MWGIKREVKVKTRSVRNEKGLALLSALTAIMLLTFVAIEVSYDTNVEYLLAAQQVNRVKAYEAARAGLEISLLRIHIYKTAMASFGSQLGASAAMLDPIWQFPFSWPPVLPDNISTVDKSQLKKLVSESQLQSQYMVTIESEGSKIDINDLGSELEGLRLATRRQLEVLFQSQIQNNRDFSRRFSSFNFTELINNIQDWIDPDSESLNGGPESALYPGADSQFVPPNQPFKTLSELQMVAGMTDEFFNLLAPRITVYGVKGVNVNYSSREVLMSLDPTMTEEAVKNIMKRRDNLQEGGPFRDANDFFGFAQGFGVDVRRIQQNGVPLYFAPEMNFRIKATGQFANVTREIEVVTYDYQNLIPRYNQMFMEEWERQQSGQVNPQGQTPITNPTQPTQGQAGQGPGAAQGPQISPPQGRPTIVYWKET